jgi:hypothetical protein
MSVVSAQNYNGVCCCPCHVGLTKNIEACCSCWIPNAKYSIDVIMVIIEKCFEEIEKLEQSGDKMSDNLKIHYDELRKFQERHTWQVDENRKVSRCIDDLENRLKILESNHLGQQLDQQVCKFLNDKVEKLESELSLAKVWGSRSFPQQPHKCPVCDGTRICHSKDSGLSWQCQSCDGKGIVWG